MRWVTPVQVFCLRRVHVRVSDVFIYFCRKLSYNNKDSVIVITAINEQKGAQLFTMGFFNKLRGAQKGFAWV